MKLSEVPYGNYVRLDLRVLEPSDVQARPGDEVEFLMPDGSFGPLLRIGGEWLPVEGEDRNNSRLLEDTLEENVPQVVWVDRWRGTSGGYPRLRVGVRKFVRAPRLDEHIAVGVDDRVVEDLRARVPDQQLVGIADAIGWLQEQTLLPPRHGGTLSRILVSSGSREDPQGAFSLHGRDFRVDVCQNRDGVRLVERIVSRGSARQAFPITLCELPLGFLDASAAGAFRTLGTTALDRIVAQHREYFPLWSTYNQISRENVLKRARRAGHLRYHGVEAHTDGTWRFLLSKGTARGQGAALFDEGEEIEAAEQLPAELTESAPGTESETRPAAQAAFVGVRASSGLQSTEFVELAPPPGRRPVRPPESGFLFLSLRGDLKALQRREEAAARIFSGLAPMPTLSDLIEGRAVPIARRRPAGRMSRQTREALGTNPTPKQLEALEVAMNVPDIALIQGPPGTGKTKLIAALQVWLGETASKRGHISGTTLLTSYQHDAVETACARTSVFGLPAIKIDTRHFSRDRRDSVDRWRRERILALDEELARSRGRPGVQRLRCIRDRWAVYEHAPPGDRPIAEFLTEALATLGEDIPGDLRDRIRAEISRIELRAREPGHADLALEHAIRSIRSLRVDPVAFLDDGALTAAVARRLLEKLQILGPEDRSVLESAERHVDDSAPHLALLEGLASFKQQMLDRLLARLSSGPRPGIESRTHALVAELLQAARAAVLTSAEEGADTVVAAYRDDLECDPDGVRQTLEKYTAVLGATCQHAVARPIRELKQDEQTFETVIVDEAARANPLDLLIPLSVARRRIVLVGDHRQLPHILEPDVERELERPESEETVSALRKSMFEHLFEKMRELERLDGVKRTVMLDTQFRMHPALGEFVSRTFYERHGDQPICSSRPGKELMHGIRELGRAVACWLEVPTEKGGEEGHHFSRKRPAEALAIAKWVRRILDETSDLTVGVITFYAAQVDEICQALSAHGLARRDDANAWEVTPPYPWVKDRDGQISERLRVGTVDAFQGREFDIVLLSIVRSNAITGTEEFHLRRRFGHLMLENRLCVAMSRQKRLLIVAGDSTMLRGAAAERRVAGLVAFRHLCEGDHGRILRA